MKRDFLDLVDAGPDGLRTMLAEAARRKAARAGWPKGKADADAPLAGHVLAMLFEKTSTRTRVSFDMAMRQLGGTTIVMDAGTTQLGRGETIADTARVLSRYVDAIMIRTDDHEKAVEMAAHASVPVINALTDKSHPCQIVADIQTVVERKGKVEGSRWAWLGDGNNVLYSIWEAALLLGFDLNYACPDAYRLPDESVGELDALRNSQYGAESPSNGPKIQSCEQPRDAATDADIVVTDTWVSMGQAHAAEKLAALTPYQVDETLMGASDAQSIFLHCLPAHRGEEVTEAVIDGPQSAIWDEAENRLHAQKAVLLWCFGKI